MSRRVSHLLRALSFVFVATPLVAHAAPLRLTNHTGIGCTVASPSPNVTATLVAFVSDCDFTAENPDGNREIFQVDRAGTIVQLTTTSDCANANPSSNSSGGVVAFDSDCDTGDNADRNVEIMVANSGVVVQVTDTSFCSNLAPALTSNGALVAFDSDCDLTAANIDRSVEIFRASIAGGLPEQLTDDRSVTGCASINASTSNSGGAIAFESDCDLTGANGDQVNEIFESRTGIGVRQVTTSPGEPCANVTPSMSPDGSRVAFASDCDLVAENVDLSSEIYTIVPGGAPAQVTVDDTSNGCESFSPTVATKSGVERTVFVGYCDPTGENTDGNLEIFREMGGLTMQLTKSQSCWNSSPQFSRQDDAVVFVSTCNLDGADPDGEPDIYLEQACACGAPNNRDGPTATEALYTLNAAVGALTCGLCDCDVNDDGQISAFDALLILNKAIGQAIELDCP